MSTSSTRLWQRGAVVAILAIATFAFAPAGANHRAGGTLLLGLQPYCYEDPACQAMKTTCFAEFAVKDGVHSSIVDISDIKGLTKRFNSTGVHTPPTAYRPALMWEFWNSSCQSLGGTNVVTGPDLGESRDVRIPNQTKWIVVQGLFVSQVSWNFS